MADSSAPLVTTSPATPDRVAAVTRIVAVAAVVALIALSIGWELVWARTGRGTLVWKALPLVLALPGLLKHRMYTYRWLSLAIWLYVAEGVVRITDRAPSNWFAGIELVLSIVLFTACATQVRWRHEVARRLPPADVSDADAGTAH
jgi:uncharacterized membrane protein